MGIFHVLKSSGEKPPCLVCLLKHEALSNKVESFHCFQIFHQYHCLWNCVSIYMLLTISIDKVHMLALKYMGQKILIIQ